MTPEPDKALTEMMGDVVVPVRVTVGRDGMRLEEIAQLKEGDIIHWGRMAGEPMEVYLADRLMGFGNVVRVNNRYGIRITAAIHPSDTDRSSRYLEPKNSLFKVIPD